MLTQISACARNFDESKCLSFLIDAELLEKYNKIWDKINSIKFFAEQCTPLVML